jgi:pyruvate/2-oxoglutarate dehydrogenase complex dihydrolipoamide acyltransferase (E2) component
MAVEIKIPSLGEGVESGDVLELMVAEGDAIEKGQSVLELETDKATVMVPSTESGVVKSISCAEGDTVAVGQAVIVLEAFESSAPAPAPEPAPAPAAAPAPEPEPTPEPAPEPAPQGQPFAGLLAKSVSTWQTCRAQVKTAALCEMMC